MCRSWNLFVFARIRRIQLPNAFAATRAQKVALDRIHSTGYEIEQDIVIIIVVVIKFKSHKPSTMLDIENNTQICHRIFLNFD